MNRLQSCLYLFAVSMVILTPSVGNAATLTTLVDFNGTNGANPESTLVADAAGDIYGTTENGGTSSVGTVFEIPAGTNSLNTVVNFNGTNGSRPQIGLSVDSVGNLLGSTYNGGVGYITGESDSGSGTVFDIPAGTNSLNTLVQFTGQSGSVPGWGPGSVISDAGGNLYIATSSTVFEIPSGTNQLMTLASFNGSNGGGEGVTGSLVVDSAGNLYGTTFGGGQYNYGTVFEIANGSHQITTLASFDGYSYGAGPISGLVADSAGNMYGAAGAVVASGTPNTGTVFEVSAVTHEFSIIHPFSFRKELCPKVVLSSTLLEIFLERLPDSECRIIPMVAYLKYLPARIN